RAGRRDAIRKSRRYRNHNPWCL
ncbi:ketopantoate reductase PanE/ApbA family protein, partial [Vibrio parahaemolyticus V-223/04]